jgi:hypothetical protein
MYDGSVFSWDEVGVEDLAINLHEMGRVVGACKRWERDMENETD